MKKEIIFGSKKRKEKEKENKSKPLESNPRTWRSSYYYFFDMSTQEGERGFELVTSAS
jgi:hypothetical protein